MNDGYRYKNGKVIVSEYNADNANVREETQREYQDNIEEILIAENMIEYFKNLKEEVDEELGKKKQLFYALIITMYIKAVFALFINRIISGTLFILVEFCLHLFEIIPVISLDRINQLIFLISTSGTVLYYINKVIKPTKKEMQTVKKEISVSEFTIEKIDEEISRQKEITKKLNEDKRKDNEQSLAYDSEYKWSSDYIRLDYVEQIDNLEENILGLVDIEEEKIKQEQSERKLTKKLKK